MARKRTYSPENFTILSESDIERYRALLRALWTLLYAHYEGFCKYVWDVYLSEIEKTETARKMCILSLASLSCQKQFKKLNADLSPENMFLFMKDRFNEILEGPIEFPVKMSTQYNLEPDVLIDNSKKLGLDYSLVEQLVAERDSELNSLVKRRHEIAHGKKNYIETIEDYQKHENAALEVMYELAFAVIRSLDERLYLEVT